MSKIEPFDEHYQYGGSMNIDDMVITKEVIVKYINTMDKQINGFIPSTHFDKLQYDFVNHKSNPYSKGFCLWRYLPNKIGKRRAFFHETDDKTTVWDYKDLMNE